MTTTIKTPHQQRADAIRKQLRKSVAGWYNFDGRDGNWAIYRIKRGAWAVNSVERSIIFTVPSLDEACFVVATYDAPRAS